MSKIHVSGMDCSSCAKTIDTALSQAGFSNTYTNYATGEVQFNEELSDERLEYAIQQVNQLGYKAKKTVQEQSDSRLGYEVLVSLILTLPLWLSMFLDSSSIVHHPFVQLGLSLPVVVLGSLKYGKIAFQSFKIGAPTMDVLIILGFSSAFIYSLFALYHTSYHPQFETANSIIVFALIGKWIEKRAVQATHNHITELSHLLPQTAQRLNHLGEIETIPLDQVRLSDILIIRTGDTIPVDGKLFKGALTLNESMLTGESLPVEKNKGTEVKAGTLVFEGSAELIVTATGSKTVLNQILEHIKSAQMHQPKIQKIGDRVSHYFVFGILALSVFSFFLNYWGFHHDFITSLLRSIGVLVVSCPCAMGLATPTAIVVSIGVLAKKGIVIKSAQALEVLAQAEHFIFDKTGTLTTGQFSVLEVHLEPSSSLIELKTIVFNLEKYSSHPIAQSLVKWVGLERQSLIITQSDEVRGVGLFATDQNKDAYKITNECYDAQLKDYNVFVYKNGIGIGALKLEDALKKDTKETLKHLKVLNYKISLLSGDQVSTVQRVANFLDISPYFGAQSPLEKLTYVEQSTLESISIMVGDGMNDAAALQKAHLGITFGGATSLAQEAAAIVILDPDHLEPLLELVDLSKVTLKTIKQNLFWAFLYNLIAIPFAMVGIISPLWGSLSMAFSDLVVVGNSLLIPKKASWFKTK